MRFRGLGVKLVGKRNGFLRTVECNLGVDLRGIGSGVN
jgi:hypothetical protein